MAAPTPIPVIPASEIGESITRSGPNSSTRPRSTLNGVPASATSSPITKTEGSRRSSSRSASLMAWPNVSSRTPPVDSGARATLGVDMHPDLLVGGERRGKREGHAVLDGLADARLDLRELVLPGDALLAQPAAVAQDRIALVAPARLLLARAVVRPIDVSDVVSVRAVGLADQERRALGPACPLDGLGR